MKDYFFEFFQIYLEQIYVAMKMHAPRALMGFVILFIGWIAAKILQQGARLILQKAGLDKALSEKGKTPLSETGAQAVYVFGMLFVVLLFLNYLKLEIVAAPIAAIFNKIGDIVPNVAGGVILAVIAYLLARLARSGILFFGEKIDLDKKLQIIGIKSQEGRTPPTKWAGDVIFFVIIIIFLPAILGYLKIEALRGPLQGLIEKFLGFALNLLGSILIVAAAWFAATFVRPFVSSILGALNIDRAGQAIGLRMEGKNKLSNWGGDVAFVLIVLLSLPPALTNLSLPTLADPITDILKKLFAYLPNVAAALIIVSLAWVVARVIADLLGRLLSTIGFDVALKKMGLKAGAEANKMVVSTVATITRVIIVLLGVLEGLQTLQLNALAELLFKSIMFVPTILGAALIVGAGLYLAKLAADLVEKSAQSLGEQQSRLLSKASYVAIVIFALSVALEQLSLGADIVRAVVQIVLAGVAVSFALAVGLGSKDHVANWWAQRARKK